MAAALQAMPARKSLMRWACVFRAETGPRTVPCPPSSPQPRSHLIRQGTWPCATDQQVQRVGSPAAGDLHRDTLLPAAEGGKVRHGPETVCPPPSRSPVEVAGRRAPSPSNRTVLQRHRIPEGAHHARSYDHAMSLSRQINSEPRCFSTRLQDFQFGARRDRLRHGTALSLWIPIANPSANQVRATTSIPSQKSIKSAPRIDARRQNTSDRNSQKELSASARYNVCGHPL